jgi:hypothetical protein
MMRYRTALVLAAAIGAASLYTPAAKAGVSVGGPAPVHARPAVVVPAPAVGAYFGPAPFWGAGYFGGYRRFGRGFYGFGFGHPGFGYRHWGYHRR